MIVNCPICESDVPHCNEKCPTCGHYIGPPNVREVQNDEEKKALDERYNLAIETAKNGNYLDILQDFESHIKKSCVVIDFELISLHFFLYKEENLYSSYSLAKLGQFRKAKLRESDSKREMVEAYFFPGYSAEIRYAALSLNGCGLKSYGEEYSLKLKNLAIEARTSFLEENTYRFFEKKMNIDGKIQPGFRCDWINRSKLSIAKLVNKINAATKTDQYSQILMYSDGIKNNDDFIEAHIYGAFDRKAVESITGISLTGDPQMDSMVKEIKDILKNNDQSWIEKT